MTDKLSKEQYWKLFQKLPNDLKTQLLSEETATNIFDICDRNEIEKVPKLASIVGRVLLGLLPPTDLQGVLEDELKLKKDKVKKVVKEIYRFILFPVKNSLEELYRIEIAPIAKMPVTPPPEEKPPIPPKKDIYREPIED